MTDNNGGGVRTTQTEKIPFFVLLEDLKMLKFDIVFSKPLIVLLVLLPIIGFSGCKSFDKKPQKKSPDLKNRSPERKYSPKNTRLFIHMK